MTELGEVVGEPFHLAGWWSRLVYYSRELLRESEHWHLIVQCTFCQDEH